MIEQTLNSWDVEDDDFQNDENLIYNEATGLYTKICKKKDEDGQEILEYRLETVEVSESVKIRKLCKKFGKSRNDASGPNPANTYLGDEVIMKFVSDEIATVEEEKKTNLQSVRCRNCQGDHFTHKCPYKEEIKNIQELTEKLDGINVDSSENKDNKMALETNLKPVAGAYLPPHLRENATRVFNDKKRADSALTLRVSNLPEAAQESDLDDLFRPFGAVSRTFLVKDRNTGSSRGFAYVTFTNRADAAKAIEGVNGFGYDHCILQVQWSE